MKKISGQKGIVRTIIMIVIALLILSYFGFNLRSIANSPTSKSNFGYVKEVIVNIWTKYLKGPVVYLWKEIFLDLIWNPALNNIKGSNSANDGLNQASSTQLQTLPAN